MMIAIQHLTEDSRAVLALHFLALPSGDRYLRFATPATSQFVADYVDGIDFARDAVLAVHAAAVGDESRRALAGVVHVAFPDDCGELGVSVLPAYRRQGLGRALVERAVALAGSRGVRRLSMHLLGINGPMMGIARKLGMRIRGVGTHVSAHLDLSARHAGPDSEDAAVRSVPPLQPGPLRLNVP